MYLQQNPIDPTLPGTLPVDEVTSWPTLLDQTLATFLTPDVPPLLAMGLNIWAGLASIVVVWTGLRIAFAGAAFRPWEIVTLIIGLSIPLGMLRFYAADVPGVGVSFPLLIPAGANAIADLIRADMITEMNDGFLRLAEAFNQNTAAAVEEKGGFLGNISATIDNALIKVMGLVLQGLLSLGYALVFALCMAQVFWAKIAISILIFLGPAMIPWMVWKPMSFLFWGWFRAMITYSLYAIIAAAVLRVWGTLSLTVMESMVAEALSFTDVLDGTPSIQAIAAVPLFAAGLLAAMKVPELAGAIAGGPSGGGGLAGLVATAATSAGGKVGKLAAGAVK